MKLNRNKTNEPACAMPSGKPLRVAIIIGLASTYGREVLAGVGRYALIHGPWHLQLDYEFSRWQLPPWLKKWKGDGIISRIATLEIKNYADKSGIPVVDLNDMVRTLGLPYIYNDQAAVGRMAAEHLLEKEYRNFAFIGQRGLSWSDERASAFKEPVTKLGFTYSEFQGTAYEKSRFRAGGGMYRNSIWESESEAIREWVLQLPKPVGIMSCNSFRGMQLLELCRSAGVAVPESVAIIAGDNEETVCEITSPSLTAVELDGQTIGYHAAAILHRAMQGKDISDTAILVPPRAVVARHSSMLTAVSDDILGKSLEFIRENYRYNIMPEDVSSHVKVSLRKLQLLFRKKLNCTIHDRILTFKLEMAMTLLRQTDLNLTEIAYRSGFNYPQQLSDAFLKKSGIRPGEYRKMNPPDIRFFTTRNPIGNLFCERVDKIMNGKAMFKNNMSQWIKSLIGIPQRRAMPIMTSPGIELIGEKADHVFKSGELQFRAIKALVDRFPLMATAQSMMDLSVEAEAFGASIAFGEQETPNVVSGVLENENDIEKMRIPNIGEGRTGEYLHAVALCTSEIKDRPSLGGMIGPFSLAGRLLDMSRLMLLAAMEPKTVHMLLEKVTLFLLEYAKAFKATGCGGLIMAEPAAGLVSPKMSKEFSYDYIARIVEAVKDDHFAFILHNCGKTDRMVKELLSTGASALHVGNAVSVETILEQTPEHVPVMGNLDPSAIFRMETPDVVFETTLQLLEATRAYPHFVLSSGCDIPPGTPMENISAFFEALEKYNSSQEN